MVELYTKTLRKMLRDHSLSRVEFTVSLRGVTARAIPDTFNPLVAERRHNAFAGHPSRSISLLEAEAITQKSMAAVASATGCTIEAATEALSYALQSTKDQGNG